MNFWSAILESVYVLLMLSGSDSHGVIVVVNIWTIMKSVTTTVTMSGLIVVLTVLAIESIAARRIADASG
jgi:uncharacterized membrane protein YhaH (DUF805 family)